MKRYAEMCCAVGCSRMAEWVLHDGHLDVDEIYTCTDHVGALLLNRQTTVTPITFPELPTIVCLCGSTRFWEDYQKAFVEESLKGHIVLTVAMRTSEVDNRVTPEIKQMLDELHLRKVDLADEILVLNVDGYIGESTRNEIAYAVAHGKTVRFLEQ